MSNKQEPVYMQHIWEEVARELTEEHETAARELDKYHQYRAGAGGELEWCCEEVAKHLALLHEGLIEWTGMIGEDALIMLYLTTIPNACLVRVDEDTGEYKSALYVLADEDSMVVMADTEDASIMSGVGNKLIMRCKLPYADLIDKKTREYYNAARSVRQLESIITPTGEAVKVLFRKKI